MYAVGYFDGPNATFGPYSEVSLGSKDGFVVRLDVTCFNYVNDSLTSVNSHLQSCKPFVVPSALSPNSHVDGFAIQNGACITKGEWTVYNLWGQAVFATDDLKSSWNGRDANGNLLPAGTYYYVLNSTEGEQITATGQLMLIR